MGVSGQELRRKEASRVQGSVPLGMQSPTRECLLGSVHCSSCNELRDWTALQASVVMSNTRVDRHIPGSTNLQHVDSWKGGSRDMRTRLSQSPRAVSVNATSHHKPAYPEVKVVWAAPPRMDLSPLLSRLWGSRSLLFRPGGFGAIPYFCNGLTGTRSHAGGMIIACTVPTPTLSVHVCLQYSVLRTCIAISMWHVLPTLVVFSARPLGGEWSPLHTIFPPCVTRVFLGSWPYVLAVSEVKRRRE
jgi:hypothetical protein